MGDELFKQVTDATGLPNELISAELTRLLERSGIDPQAVTLDDLRRVLAEYVQDVLLSAKSDFASSKAVNE